MCWPWADAYLEPKPTKTVSRPSRRGMKSAKARRSERVDELPLENTRRYNRQTSRLRVIRTHTTAAPRAQTYYPHPVYSVAPGYYHPYPPAAPLAVAAPVPVVHVSPALMPSSHTANHHTYVPAADGATGAAHAADAQANAWLGRTTAQVEEDNMKIAKAEGAYDKRQVAPTGLKDDQMCWVVELDGTHTLRMFRDVKAMNGVWKEDPRYKDAWYFICEEEEKEEEEEKKKD